jgi:Tol biopolymer transport system component
MTLVSLATRERREIEGRFDYLSPLSWSPDGKRVVAVRYTQPDASGRVTGTILEVNTVTGAVVETASFENVFQAAPAGYSADGERMFVVVVDQAGSALWVERAGTLQRLAVMSPGRTRDWKLSPDGARLAYVDILGAGERGYAGRTMLTATGAITRSPATRDELGVAWRPNSEVPVFGGPGGGVRLSLAQDGPAYVVPVQWSPDGTTLAATVYTAADGRVSTFDESLELVTPDQRVLLSERPGARFFGWAVNLE